MYCPYCRNPVKHRSEYCSVCGKRLPGKTRPTAAHPHRRLILLIAILALAVGGFFAIRGILASRGNTLRFDLCAEEWETDFEPEPQVLSRGQLSSCPPYPVRDGWVFGGWYADPDYRTPFLFGQALDGDTVAYARWLSPDDPEAQLTEEQALVIEQSIGEINAIGLRYEGEDGYIPPSAQAQALGEIEDYVRGLQQAGTVGHYHRNEDSVYVEFSSGLIYLYRILEPDTFSGDSSFRVTAISPYDSEDSNLRGIAQSGADIFDGVFPGSSSSSYLDGQVSLSLFAEALSGDILLWVGHGSYDSILHSVLITGETCEITSDLQRDLKVLSLATKGLILTNAHSDSTRIGISASYLKKNCNWDFSGGMVFLLACKSGKDDTLVNAILQTTGAELVFAPAGNDNISIAYGEYIMLLALHYMSGAGPDLQISGYENALNSTDGIYHPAEEALDYANQFMTLYSEQLIRPGFQFDGHSYLIDRETGQVIVRDSYYKVWGAEGVDYKDYTLVSGIKGTLVSTNGSVDFAQDDVRLVLKNCSVEAFFPRNSSTDFYFQDLSAGDYTLECYVNSRLCASQTVTVREHRFTDLGELDLSTLPTDITVYNEAGAFLSNAIVTVTPLTAENVPSATEQSFQAVLGRDENGNPVFQVCLAPGRYTVLAECEGYAPQAEALEIPRSSRNLNRVRLVLSEGCTALGNVARAGNKDKLLGDVLVRFEGEGWQLETRSSSLNGRYGRFELEHIPKGACTVTIHKAGYYDEVRTVRLREDQPLDLGTIYLKPKGPYTPVLRNVFTGGETVMAVREDGSVQILKKDGWKYDEADWSGVESIDGDPYHVGVHYAIRSDGSVLASSFLSGVLDGWSDISMITMGRPNTYYGLRRDGTVIRSSEDPAGTSMGEDWNNVVQIVGYLGEGLIGVRRDGSLVHYNIMRDLKIKLAEWEDIIMVCGGCGYLFGLQSNGAVIKTPAAPHINSTYPCDVTEWEDIIKLAGGEYMIAGLRADGTVVASGQIFVWKDGDYHSVDPMSLGLDKWTDVVDLYVFNYTVIGVRSDGSLLLAGSPLATKYDSVSSWSGIKHS